MGKRRPLRNNLGPSKTIRMELNNEDNNNNKNIQKKKIKQRKQQERERKEEEDDDDLDNNENNDSDNDSESDNEKEDNLLAKHSSNDLISMTFEFNDMKESYSYGIALMLQFILLKHEGRTVGDVIASQSEVGTAVVCEEGDDVFAYASIVPLSKILDGSNYFQQFFDELTLSVTQLNPDEGVNQLLSCINGSRRNTTGVYFQGRYVNLPVQLITPLHSNLLEDLQWFINQERSQNSTSTSSNSDSTQVTNFSNLEYVIMFTPASTESNSSQLKKGTCRNITGSSSAVIFNNFEDDIFFSYSNCVIQFQPSKITSESNSTVCVFLLPLNILSKCIDDIRLLIPS